MAAGYPEVEARHGGAAGPLAASTMDRCLRAFMASGFRRARDARPERGEGDGLVRRRGGDHPPGGSHVGVLSPIVVRQSPFPPSGSDNERDSDDQLVQAGSVENAARAAGRFGIPLAGQGRAITGGSTAVSWNPDWARPKPSPTMPRVKGLPGNGSGLLLGAGSGME